MSVQLNMKKKYKIRKIENCKRIIFVLEFLWKKKSNIDKGISNPQFSKAQN